MDGAIKNVKTEKPHNDHGRKWDKNWECYDDEIYAIQRSEIIDSHTCNFCLSMDGLVMAKSDKLAKIHKYHPGCRGIRVAIMSDEVNPPPIKPVPIELTNCYKGKNEELVQPKIPIIRLGSYADREIKRGALKLHE
jgi:hypothetical protein